MIPRRRSPWKKAATKNLARRTIRHFAIVLIVAVTLILIVLSPLGLEIMASRHSIDWSRLSDIGQAYGAISAILSALALVAISVSLGVQARESLANRRHVQREFHARLSEMAMNDPLYMPYWLPRSSGQTHDERRQLVFANLVVSLWYMFWELGDMSTEALEVTAQDFFRTKEGREFWSENRDTWSSTSIGSRLDRFHGVIDNAYH